MAKKIITPLKGAFIKYELDNGDARRKKVALQELTRLYRTGCILKAEGRNELENAINGTLLVGGQDKKVVRWSLNALARMGRRGNSDAYISLALKQYAEDPEITAAGVAAIASMYGQEMWELPIIGSIDPAIKILSALQNSDPKTIDLTKLRIKVDTADKEVLKLALITVGLNRDVENLFDPKHSNAQIVKVLAQHDDPIVVQYSVWAVLENLKLVIADLGLPLGDLEKQPANVQSKLLQLVSEKGVEAATKNDVIIRGTFLPSVEAREGLAKGLLHVFYDGLEATTISWFEQETEPRVKELLAEHFGRFAEICGPYEDQAFQIIEAEPALVRRISLGAEGTPMYGKIRAKGPGGGTLDLFAALGDSVGGPFERGLILAPKRAKKTVLVLNASPKGEGRLRLDEEARDLVEQLALVQHPQVEVAVVHRWAVRTDQIQETILNAKPEILHFSGHGASGLLCFEDKAGASKAVTKRAFEELCRLSARTVECVVLSACHSDDVAAGASKHIKFVVGCDGSIADDAAIAFSRAFYRALANSRAYGEAFDWAVNEVRITVSDTEADKFSMRVKQQN